MQTNFQVQGETRQAAICGGESRQLAAQPILQYETVDSECFIPICSKSIMYW